MAQVRYLRVQLLGRGGGFQGSARDRAAGRQGAGFDGLPRFDHFVLSHAGRLGAIRRLSGRAGAGPRLAVRR
jgi:hypothetical protein